MDGLELVGWSISNQEQLAVPFTPVSAFYSSTLIVVYIWPAEDCESGCSCRYLSQVYVHVLTP